MTSPGVLPPGDPTDVASKRIVGAVIDVGIGAVISTVLFVVLAEGSYRYDRFTDQFGYTRELRGTGALLFYGWLLAYNVGVFVLQRGITGRTLGTIAMGLVTVNERGGPPGPARALLRSVAGIVDYLPCCAPLVGLLTIFMTPEHRRIGDMAANTYVIDAGAPFPTGGLAPAPVAPTASAPPAPVPYDPLRTGPTPPPKLPEVLPTNPATPSPYTSSAAGWAPTSPTSPTSRSSPVPQWDPERRAYIAWDPERQQWLQFDQPSQIWLQYDPVTQQWRPVT